MTERKIVVVTSLGKRFVGNVDIPNSSLRTTDLMNSGSIYWRDPSEKCFENAILMHDVQLQIEGLAASVRFEKLQIKISEIILFYDYQETIADEKEKMRAATMVQKTQEKVQVVNIITTEVANSFYNMTGSFYGLFKKKSNDRFIPLTQVKLTEVYRENGNWYQRVIELPHKFIGVSTRHIEAVRIS